MPLYRIFEEMVLVGIREWQKLFRIAHDLISRRKYEYFADIFLVIVVPIARSNDITGEERLDSAVRCIAIIQGLICELVLSPRDHSPHVI